MQPGCCHPRLNREDHYRKISLWRPIVVVVVNVIVVVVVNVIVVVVVVVDNVESFLLSYYLLF